MKVNHLEFMPELVTIRDQIRDLAKRRNEIVAENSKEILRAVRRMMDWETEDIERSSVEYSPFEQAIMIEVKLKNDSTARWVFCMNAKDLHLRFREDFAKQDY